MVGPHCEHGEAEAEAEEGQEHRVQVVQVERGHRVELQKRAGNSIGAERGASSPSTPFSERGKFDLLTELV